MQDLVFVLDRKGTFIHVNRAIAELLDYEPRDVIQKSFLDLMSSKSRTQFEDYLHEGKQGQKLRDTFLVRKGNGIEAEVTINCTILENDQVYGVIREEQPWRFEEEAVEDANEPEIDVFAGDLYVEAPEAEQDRIPPMLGPYRVATLLGAGSMGRVYKGFDDQLERPVAIKVISKELTSDPDYLERFQKEARILASMAHPNIALIYYFDRANDPPFFCMEFMPGGSLEDVLQQKGKLDPEGAVSYTMQVAIGLDEAYKRGVVHQDIKPSNLMLADDRIKIVDFGLARTSREIEEGPAEIAGTPMYIAPEQMQEGRADFRSDIYSLGVTFFRMLYGRTPFSGGSLVEILYNQFHAGLPARETLDQGVPAALYSIIQKMVSADPAQRYLSYSDLIQDLEKVRRELIPHAAPGSEEILAAPEQAAVQFRGLVYDHPIAEVLGDVLQKNLSGKLTLSWMDIYKHIYVVDGKIVAVLSNQEGENFVELLLEKNRLTAKRARAIQHRSFDLMIGYSTAVKEVGTDVRAKISADATDLAWKILQGIFSWIVGEVMFETGGSAPQALFQLPAGEVLVRGIKEFADPGLIHRRLNWGRCRIRKDTEFQKKLLNIKMKPADAFLLFRFEDSVDFQDLFPVSGIAEEEFYRLIYLFNCSGVVSIEELREQTPVKPPKREYVPPILERPAETVKVEAAVRKTQAPEIKPRPSAPPAPKKPVPKKTEPEKIALVPQPASPPQGPQRKQDAVDPAKYYAQCAKQSFAQKNYWATVEYCKKSLEVRKDPVIFQLMGNAFSTHPKFRQESLEAYKQAMEMDPLNASVQRDMGDLYFAAGSYALARARYEEALKLDPQDLHATERLSEIRSRKK
jgi:PAS domain S-box-containing protein